MRNRLEHLQRMFQHRTEDERRHVRYVGDGIELPRARRAIVLTVSGVPNPLVLVDDAEAHHDHQIELADHYGDDPLFHQAN